MINKESTNSVYDITIRLLILLFLVAWCMMLIFPFMGVLLWSMIFSLALYPLHKKLKNKLGGRPKLASAILIFGILIIIIIPTVMLINSLILEVKDLKISYDNGTLRFPPPTEKVREWPVIGETVFNTWQTASENLGKLFIKYKDHLIGIGSSIAKNILSLVSDVIQLILSLFIAGVLLCIESAGESTLKFFRKISGKKGDEFAEIILKTVSSVVKGILGESLVMSLLLGLVFMLAGIPYAGIWTLMVFIFAILQIPVILTTIPAIIYFFSTMETSAAVLWTIILLLVSLMDNILTPVMLGKGAPVPMLVIFIGVLGGFAVSGFVGLFTGAIVLSVGYNLLVGWINTEEIEPGEEVQSETEK